MTKGRKKKERRKRNKYRKVTRLHLKDLVNQKHTKRDALMR